MARDRTLEEKLSALQELAAEPDDAVVAEALRKALKGKNNALAATAANLARNRGLRGLTPELAAAFARFMDTPERSDKGCLAKVAIVKALKELDYELSDVFERGLRHVQFEPVYGGKEDTAADLRGQCALALARLALPGVLFDLLPLLTDPERAPRKAAARAVAYLGSEDCELLLRMKALTGDEDPEVMAECFTGLMGMAPERSSEFVAGYLEAGDPAVAEGAALALGESRSLDAFLALREAYESSIDTAFKEMLLLPIALARRDESYAFLLEAVRESYRDTALAALQALRTCVQDEERLREIEEAGAWLEG